MKNFTPASPYDFTETESAIPALLDEISKNLGTSEMSLDEMILEMRQIRESSDYENATDIGQDNN